MKPGDTIWLRGGTYRGAFVSTLTGHPRAPVVLRQAPGARATIDGGLEVRGADATYWGFEVMNSDTLRINCDNGPTQQLVGVSEEHFMAGLRLLASEGLAIVVVTHDAEHPGVLGAARYVCTAGRLEAA